MKAFTKRFKQDMAIVVLVILAFVTFTPSYAEEKGSIPTRQYSASIEEDLNDLWELQREYKRDEAYALLNRLIVSIDIAEEPDAYLEVLNQLVWFERRYQIYDKMIKHTAQQYRLATTYNQVKYKILALDALAAYDYYNLDTYDMSTKISEMLTLSVNVTDQNLIVQTMVSVGMLALAEKRYDDARTSLLEAYEALKGVPFNPQYYYNEGDLLVILAQYEGMIGNSDRALNYLKDAALSIDSRNKGALFEVYYARSRFYLLRGDLVKAKTELDMAESYYLASSNLYQSHFSNDHIKVLRASLAYYNGDFKTAASLYQETYWSPDNLNNKDSEAIQAETLEGLFDEDVINEKFMLIKQLKAAQANQIEVQKQLLLTAYLAIAMLLLLMVGFIIAMRWYMKQRKHLYHLSITDQLTQIFNRSKIMECYEKSKPGTICVALMDLDHFKTINDEHGHLMGDFVLKTVAQVIKSNLRSQDLVGRYGGEEFLLILDTNDFDLANGILERIRLSVEEIVWEVPNLVTTISIGMVYSTLKMDDYVLGEVDKLLYHAKDRGRNRIESMTL